MGHDLPANHGGAYHDQVIEAAFLHSKLGCYFIGPYARRVSFASQQFRALDLIKALEIKGKIPEKGSVAVIGAGLAGVTVTAALLGLGCKVDLYETGDGALTRQRAASHRLVHPTIARWPMEGLSLTTAFPFYDWAAASCDKVMESLLSEWAHFFYRADWKHPALEFYPNTAVTSLVCNERQGKHVVGLRTAPSIGNQQYELAIITTGYGAEMALSSGSVTSYWTPDQLEDRRTGDCKFAVGGCGDGGLIDALRLAHNKFFGGWLAFAVAEKLEGTAIKDLLAHAEHDAMMMWKSMACMTKTPASMNPHYSEMLQPLHGAYLEAVEMLPCDVLQLLNDSLTAGEDMMGRIWLIAPEAQPTVPPSAPIHKLMIAHAIREGRVEWKRGKIVKKRGKYFYHSLPAEGNNSLRGFEIVQRHGASSGLEGLVNEEEIASLGLRQFMLADRIEVAHEREAVPPLGYPQRAPDNIEFISSRHPAASAMVAAIDPRFRVDAEVGGFKYVKASAEEEPQPGCGASVGVSLPGLLFGIVEARMAEMSTFETLE